MTKSAAQSTLDDLYKRRSALAASEARYRQLIADYTTRADDCRDTIAALDTAIDPLTTLALGRVVAEPEPRYIQIFGRGRRSSMRNEVSEPSPLMLAIRGIK